MGRYQKPTKLLKKHLTRAEYFTRLEAEIPIVDNTICIPDFLDDDERETFIDIAEKMDAAGIWSVTDTDALGRYVRMNSDYRRAQRIMDQYLEAGDLKQAASWGRLMSGMHRAALKTGRSLCLDSILV